MLTPGPARCAEFGPGYPRASGQQGGGESSSAAHGRTGSPVRVGSFDRSRSQQDPGPPPRVGSFRGRDPPPDPPLRVGSFGRSLVPPGSEASHAGAVRGASPVRVGSFGRGGDTQIGWTASVGRGEPPPGPPVRVGSFGRSTGGGGGAARTTGSPVRSSEGGRR